MRYGGFNDIRGGGHFSGRLTAPLCFAGALCMQYLKTKGIKIGAHLYRTACVDDERVDSMTLTAEKLTEITAKPMPVFNNKAGEAMLAAIDKARNELDSVGGIVECFVLNLPAGAGNPMCETLEGEIASLLFSVPAVKGVEFGAGFGAADLKGSENNDGFVMQCGEVKTKTNNHGGILGGISSGMPIVVRAAFKPTPSIARQQDTVDLEKGGNAKLSVKGRHDPCVAVRAVPCVEAAVAVAVADAVIRQSGEKTI